VSYGHHVTDGRFHITTKMKPKTSYTVRRTTRVIPLSLMASLSFLFSLLCCLTLAVAETASLVAESADTDTANTSVLEKDVADSETPDRDQVSHSTDAAATVSTTSFEEDQSNPLVNLLGPQVLRLEMIDESHAQIVGEPTSEALAGKTEIGLYFSADWCGPCRQFTPELVRFYEKINSKRRNTFEIVWISRCRDMDGYAQYFTQMPWIALPPEDALGERGQFLSQKYNVKGIPTLVLLDEYGSTITADARNKVPQDKAGIGFPWRHPVATVYMTVLPRSLRLLLKSQWEAIKRIVFQKLRLILPIAR
jgi:nucleoredoxin